MLFVLQLGSCSGSDIPQGGRRGGNCGGTCAHGGHDVGFVPQQAACNDRHLCAGADLGDNPGHDAGQDLDKIRLALLHHTVRTRTRFFMKKGLGTFFVYRKFCGRTTRNGKRAKAGYHYDSGILPFALRNQVRFVRTWSSPYMARLGVVAAYVRTGSLYTSDKV